MWNEEILNGKLYFFVLCNLPSNLVTEVMMISHMKIKNPSKVRYNNSATEKDTRSHF